MWGTGAADSQTIPSHFHSLTHKLVYNFGEAGWNSRQSLNQLINTIGDNHKPTAVVFYDGVNDVYHQCRSEYQLLPTHSYEKRLNAKLKGTSAHTKFLEFILSPYIAFANKFNIKQVVGSPVELNQFDCDTNQAKARLVAKHLVNNWRTAYSLSKSNDFKFYGILQPTLFSTKTNSEYLASGELKKYPAIKRQYNAVYPLILDEINRQCELDKDFCSLIIDGANWLDGRNNIFIDFCHVNSQGNEEIAKHIASLFK